MATILTFLTNHVHVDLAIVFSFEAVTSLPGSVPVLKSGFFPSVLLIGTLVLISDHQVDERTALPGLDYEICHLQLALLKNLLQAILPSVLFLRVEHPTGGSDTHD